MAELHCLTIRKYRYADTSHRYGDPQPAHYQGRLIVGTLDEIRAVVELSGPFGAMPLPADAGETIPVAAWFAACNSGSEDDG